MAIREWADDDKPREKLVAKGKEALSNAELVTILLGSGTTKLSALDVAKLVLDSCDNQLEQLGTRSIKELCKHPGIGPAKAITIIAAFELGNRRVSASRSKKYSVISSSQDVHDYFYSTLSDIAHEEFYALLLDSGNRIKSHLNISKGGVSATQVDVKLMFRNIFNATGVGTISSLILVHNHPSGVAKPSEADKSLTQKVKEAGELLGIRVLDHIIFTNSQYYSFAEEGLM